MRILLVGVYDSNAVSLAPQLLYALAESSHAEHGHEVETREFSIFGDSAEAITSSITEFGPDVVCFSCYIWNYRLVREVAAELDCTVVFGGPQVTGIEQSILATNPGVDIVVTGEGEAAFSALLMHFAGKLDLEAVPGITTREFTTPAAEPIDLATLPPLYAAIFERRPDVSWISFETSRGCPMGCGYCTWGYSRRMRYFPLEFVLQELDVILGNPRIEEIYLCDSSLLLNKKRALAILDHIIASGSEKTIRYEFGPEQLDQPIIERMALLPSNEFNFGIQTVNPRALEAIGRPFNRERFESRYRDFVDAMPSAQITVDLIFGLPGDDLDGYLLSMDYAMSLPGVARILTNPLIVLPGSRFFAEQHALGMTLADDESYLQVSNATFDPEDMLAARRYSFWINLVYLNTALRDALLARSRAETVRPTELMRELFESLDRPLVDGDYPYTIPSVQEGFERRNSVYADVLGRYGEFVRVFSRLSGGRYDDLLDPYETCFTDQYRKYQRYANRSA